MIIRLYRHLTVTHRHTTGQFVRFCLVGSFNTLLDFSVYVFLTRLFGFWSRHIVLAAVVSFAFGVTSSFILNTFWTFRKDLASWTERLPKFLTVAIGGVTWNALIIYGLTEAGIYDLIAKVFATGCVVAWNFTLQKKWTFRA
jgi:dolichol-phosphate mannosyltransferase